MQYSCGFLFACVGAVLLSACGGDEGEQKVTSMSRFVPKEMNGWVVQDTAQMYDRKTIFDYIDGAGEVFLSYDFREVAVARLAKASQPDITVELFDMGSAEDAYGIFSYARESEESGIGHGFEYRGSLLCFWKAAYYVCVMAEKVSPEAKETVYAIARAVDEQLGPPSEPPKLVGYLPQEGLIRESLRFFHLHSTLNYHYFLSEQNLLNLGHETRAVLAAYEPNSVYLLCVQYPTEEEAASGYRGFIEGYIPEAAESGVAGIDENAWVAAKQVREYVVVAFDAPTGEAAGSLTEALIQRIPVGKP
jgi:hypothetical protein